MTGEVKRSAVRARKAQEDILKNARRRQRKTTPRAAPEQQSSPQKITRYPGHGVSITVQIPPLRRQKLADGSKPANGRTLVNKRILTPVLILPVILMAIGFAVFGGDIAGRSKTPATKPVAAAQKTKPAFRPLLPSAEKASATRYDGAKDLVTYTTNFSGAKLTVSQQPLPANFSKDPQSMTKAADSIQAKQRLETGKGPIYIATNAEAGDQFALYAGKQSLVFIHSASKMDDVSW
jgi:hypothetical protein